MNALLLSLMLLGPCDSGSCRRPVARVVQAPVRAAARVVKARPVRRLLGRLRLFPNCG